MWLCFLFHVFFHCDCVYFFCTCPVARHTCTSSILKFLIYHICSWYFYLYVILLIQPFFWMTIFKWRGAKTFFTKIGWMVDVWQRAWDTSTENWQIRLCEFVGIFFTQEYFITRCLIYKFSVKMVLCYNLDAFLKALVKLSFNYYLLGVSHFHSRYWTWRHDREYQIILMLIL